MKISKRKDFANGTVYAWRQTTDIPSRSRIPSSPSTPRMPSDASKTSLSTATWKFAGYEFGFFHGAGNYDGTDMIVTPVGNFDTWKGYCDAVGCNMQ